MSYVKTSNAPLIRVATILLLLQGILIILIDTRNIHKLPMPNFDQVDIILSVCFLLLFLLIYANTPALLDNIEWVFFGGSLLILLSQVFLIVSSFMGSLSPLQDSIQTVVTITAAVSIGIMVIVFLGARNNHNVGILTGIILSTLVSTLSLATISNFFDGIWIQAITSFFAVICVALGVISLQKRYSENLRNFLLLLYLIGGILSLILTFLASRSDLMMRILSTVFYQILGLRIFSALPGILETSSGVFLFLYLISSLILAITLIVNYIQGSQKDKTVSMIVFTVALCGLNLSTPFIQLARLLGLYFFIRTIYYPGNMIPRPEKASSDINPI